MKPPDSPPPVPDHEMLAVIGEGSYGQVWRARSTLGTMRAVKVVWRDKFDSARPYEREFSGIKRFEPVSRSHEGLVDILQVGRNDEAEFFYYVMELADDAGDGIGAYKPRTLRSEIDARGRLSAEDCVNFFLTLAAALGHMHRLGLIHRDVKPSNIILVDGVAKLADIGLVAEMSESRSFVGTEGYIPPEGPNSPQADLYSLGKALYEASTGMDRMKFPTLPATGPDGLAALGGMMDLNAVAMKACMPDADARYQSGAEMLADLATMQSGRSVRDAHRSAERLRFARRWGLAAAGVAVLTAGIGGIAVWRAGVEKDSRERTEKLLLRAETAERESSERLYGQFVALARAEVLSSQAGRRFRALDALREAAKLRPGEVALRSQAIAALAIPDFRERRRWLSQRTADGSPLSQSLAPALDLYARVQPDHSVSIRRTADDTEQARLPVQPEAVEWLTFSPDGRLLLTIPPERKGGAVIWDAATGAEVLRLSAEVTQKSYAQIHFRSVQPELVMLNDDAVLVMPLNGSTPRRIPLPSRKDLLTAVHADHVLAGSRTNGRAYLVSLAAEEVVFTHPPFELSFSFGLSQDARTASMSADGYVSLYDMATGSGEGALLPGRQGAVTLMAFDPAGDVLITSGWGGTSRMFGCADRTLIAEHPAAISSRVHFHGDRIGYTDGATVDLVEAEWAGREACRTLRLPANSVGNLTTFAAGGRLILGTGTAGVQVNDAASLRLLHTVSTATVRDCVMPRADGPLHIATTAGLFRCAVQAKDGAFVFGVPQLLLPGDAWGLASSADGATLAAMAGGMIFVSRQGGEFLPFVPAPAQFRTMEVSPDGRWLVLRGSQLLVFDLHQHDVKQPAAEWSGAGISRVAFTADSRSLVICAATGIRCEPLEPGAPAWRSTEPGAAGSAACSPDGQLVIAQDSATSFLLLRPSDGRLIARVSHPQGNAIGAFAFSADSRRLLVTESNNIARVWDLAEVRAKLAELQLDWDAPAFPPAPATRPASATGGDKAPRSAGDAPQNLLPDGK